MTLPSVQTCPGDEAIGRCPGNLPRKPAPLRGGAGGQVGLRILPGRLPGNCGK